MTLWRWPGGNMWIWPFGRRPGAGGANFTPLVGDQSFGVTIAARAFAPIIGAQAIDVTIAAEELGGATFDPLGWLNILTAASVPVQAYYQADVGVSTSGAAVTAWADQSGNGRNIAVFDAPTFNATGLNGRGTIGCDGSNDGLNLNWNPPQPGTTPTWWYFVMRQRAWTAGRRLLGGSGTGMQLTQKSTAVTPQVQGANPTFGNDLISMTLNSWYRVELLFANSANVATGDYLKIGATGGTRGAAFGNTDVTGVALFARPANDLFGNGEVALAIACSAEPSGAVKTQLDALTAHATLGYGASVGV